MACRKEYVGLWEFPGTKFETAEWPAPSLVRELAESLLIMVRPEAYQPALFAQNPAYSAAGENCSDALHCRLLGKRAIRAGWRRCRPVCARRCARPFHATAGSRSGRAAVVVTRSGRIAARIASSDRRRQKGNCQAGLPLPIAPFQRAPAAQLDRAPDYETGDRAFESFRVRQFSRLVTMVFLAPHEA